jgi:hypothetical protein
MENRNAKQLASAMVSEFVLMGVALVGQDMQKILANAMILV